MKLLKDDYKSMYGTLEIETEPGSLLELDSPKKFNIDYSLDFDDFPSDTLCLEVEECSCLEEILYMLEKVDCTLLSFNSFSLGEIYDTETEMHHTLEFKIDFFTDIEDNQDIQEKYNIDYQDTFDELFELIQNMI